MLVDAIECVACGLHRQCRDLDNLAARGDGGDARGNAKTDVAEPSQLIHSGVDLLRTHPLGVEDGFSIVEDHEHLLRGQVLSQGGQVLGVLDACADDLGEAAKKMCVGCGELIATNEQRLSPNRCLIRPSWRTVRTTDVLPIPPTPIKAIGVRCCAKSTILSINSSRPKKILGGGGGRSPGALDSNVRHWTPR